MKDNLKKRNYYFFLIFLFFILNAYTQIIPENRIFDWTKAGYDGEIKIPLQIINVLENGLTANDMTDQSANLNILVNSFNGQAVQLFFPSGTYYFTQPVYLNNNIVIIGENAFDSKFIFNLSNNSQDCINITSSQSGSFRTINSGYSSHSKQITVSNVTGLAVGDYVEHLQDNPQSWNEWGIGNEDWAANSVGQINKITAISGNTITLKNEFRYSYSANLNPRIRKITPVRNVGIEKLYIERQGNRTGFFANISFNYAVNSWVRGIESNICHGTHISLVASANIEMTGNYIHHANIYSGGGNAYGITIQTRSSDNLVQDNIFDTLRHAMLLQTGANGNVFGYNYSKNPFWDDQSISDAPADLCLHGNYPYANLMEGNIANNLYIDNSHGANGPYNTFFRNRLEKYGILVQGNFSVNQNFVGNELTAIVNQYNLSSTGHFEYGNNRVFYGAVPPGTNDLQASYYTHYLNSLNPHFWDIPATLPTIGFPNTLNTGNIPAKYRYDNSPEKVVYPQKLALPEITPTGYYPENVSINFTSAIQGTRYHYTLGFNLPTYQSVIFNQPFTITQSTRINSFATQNHYYPSDINTTDYFIIKTPVINTTETTDNSITFSWTHQMYSHIDSYDPWDGITYKIYRKNHNDSQYAHIHTTTDLSYSELNNLPGTHSYYVKAYINEVHSLQSNTVTLNVQGYTLTMQAIPTGAGTTTGAGFYVEGSQINISAIPNLGFSFSHWSTDIEGNNHISSPFTMPAQNTTLYAHFNRLSYQLTLNVNPQNSGTVTGSGNYNYNQIVNITATPAQGYQFINWTLQSNTRLTSEMNSSRSIVSTNPNFVYTMPANDVILVANFAEIGYSLNLQAIPSSAGTLSGPNTFSQGQQISLEQLIVTTIQVGSLPVGHLTYQDIYL